MRKTTTIAAVVLSCTAAALAQPPAEKPMTGNFMYTFDPTPRLISPPPNVKKPDYIYEPSYQNVRPAFENLNVNRKNYPVDNQSGSVVIHPSGTALYIPQNAFADENGKEIEGEVTLSYREFKNPVDFILGGIPMSYGSEGNKNMFISAGMFEMSASANGKPAYLREDKKIDVKMVSMDKKPDYNLYAYNGTTGEWEERESKKNIQVTEATPVTYSPAVNSYLQYLSYNSRKKTVDSLSCRARFESKDYFYTKISNGPLSFKKNRWFHKGHTYTALVKIMDVRRNKKDNSIVFRIENPGGGTHPELGIYSRTAWKVNASSYKELKKILSNKNGFFDVRIEKQGEDYAIRLKGANGFTEILAEPMRMNREKKVSQVSQKTKKYFYKTYCRLLKSREKSFDRQTAREMKRARKVVSKEKHEQMAWNNSKNIMTADEKEMPLANWKVYAEAERKNQRKLSDAMAANSSNIIRSFSVDGMGIWNCDQIYRLQDPVTVVARYADKDGNRFKANATYVIDKNLNGVLQYYSDEIIFSPTSDNIFIAVKPNGEIAYTTSADLKERAYANKQAYVFALKEVNTSGTTVEELRKLIGM